MSILPTGTPMRRLTGSWLGVPASVAEARAAVAGFAATAGATSEGIAAVKVAVSEAVTNAVLHAYLDAPSAGLVHVEAECEAQRLRVRVTDEGRGMLPRSDSPGIGLGLPLIAQMTQAFEVRSGAAGGTCLDMSFALDAASAVSPVSR